jgi:hypothetical protein
MFIKKTRVSNLTYIQIVKTFRDGKKVRHRVVLNLGRTDKINEKDIDNLINVLQQFKATRFAGEVKWSAKLNKE